MENESKPVTLVFGATGGIGSAVSRALSSKGHALMLAARGEESLEKLGSELNADICKTDVTDLNQVNQCFNKTKEIFGRVDNVVLAVGSILLKPAHLTTEDEWFNTISKNLTSAFFVVKSAAQAMRQQKGSIVLFSSCAGQRGLPNHEAISAAKAGIIGLTQSAAASYASQGLRFNCIAPGLVNTPMSSSITSNEAALKYSKGLHALKRIGEPQDIAPAVSWLLSDDSSWVTGQVIGIDGGLVNVQPK